MLFLLTLMRLSGMNLLSICLLLSSMLVCGYRNIDSVSFHACLEEVRHPCDSGVIEFPAFGSALDALTSTSNLCDHGFLWRHLLFEENSGELCETGCLETSLPLQAKTDRNHCEEYMCSRINRVVSDLQCDVGPGLLSAMDAYDFTSLVTMLSPRKSRVLRGSVVGESCPSPVHVLSVGIGSGVLTFLALLMTTMLGKRVIVLRKSLLLLQEQDATTVTSMDSTGSGSTGNEDQAEEAPPLGAPCVPNEPSVPFVLSRSQIQQLRQVAVPVVALEQRDNESVSLASAVTDSPEEFISLYDLLNAMMIEKEDEAAESPGAQRVTDKRD